VLADGGALRHGLDHRSAEVLRVRAREPDPLDAVHRVAGAQQLAELGADLGQQVAAPRVHVLAEQGQLPDSLPRELRHLGEHVARPAAHLAAAHRRDDAVRARGVAAHRDLHPGLEPTLAVHRQARGEGALLGRPPRPSLHAEPARAQPFAEVRDRARAECDVDVRIEGEETFALGLGVAAADRDHHVRSLALACSCIAHVGGELRVRLLADRAGVEDDDVGLGLRRRLAEPELFEHPLDALGVVRVHLAPERRDVVPAVHGRRVAVAGPRLLRRRGGRRVSPASHRGARTRPRGPAA
jgi:hypothetical protein